MGYLTTVMVMNDAYSTIQDNKEEFANNVLNGMKQRGVWESYGVGNHGNPMQIVSSRHADEPQLVIVHQNLMTRFGYGCDLTDSERDLEIRKQRVELAKSILKNEQRIIQDLEEKLKK